MKVSEPQLRKTHRLFWKTRKTKILSQLSKAACFRYEVGNRDINVVEQADIPKFSKLDNTGTPLKLFESFFP